MSQEYKQRSRETVKEEVSEEQVRGLGAEAIKDTDLDKKVDDLLEEIDEVLESNAEEFVESFIQKGGQ